MHLGKLACYLGHKSCLSYFEPAQQNLLNSSEKMPLVLTKLKETNLYFFSRYQGQSKIS